MFACVARSFSHVVIGLPLGLVPCMRNDNGNDNEPSAMTPTLAKISCFFFLQIVKIKFKHKTEFLFLNMLNFEY